MSTIIGLKSLAQNSMNVFGFFDFFVFSHDQHIGFDEILFKACGLTEKSPDNLSMILC